MSSDLSGKRYLMCRPTHFDVVYSINPWMDPAVPTSDHRSLSQWKTLHDVFVELGHEVDLVEPEPGLPDMVYSANGALVIGDKALVARFRHEQRVGESAAYLEWFRIHGFTDVRQATHLNEGEGDLLLVGSRILAGSGFRSERRAHREVAEFFGLPVVGLTLVNPRYYHLDTALAVLNEQEVMYYPPAFDAASLEVLETLYPDAIQASATDARVFGLNAVSDGTHVVLPEQAVRLADQLRERGFTPVGVDLSELLKGGGGVKCCTLTLHGEVKT